MKHEYIGRKDDRTPNAPFAPDGEMWSSVQEWWNNNKQSIQQSIKLYGESLATSGAFGMSVLGNSPQRTPNMSPADLRNYALANLVVIKENDPKGYYEKGDYATIINGATVILSKKYLPKGGANQSLLKLSDKGYLYLRELVNEFDSNRLFLPS